MKGGRASAADRDQSIIPFKSDGSSVAVPEDLTKEEEKLLRQILASVPAIHFVDSDVTVLVSFVKTTILANKAYAKIDQDDKFLHVWDVAVNNQARLAAKLRLVPQSRADFKNISRKAKAFQETKAVKQLWG